MFFNSIRLRYLTFGLAILCLGFTLSCQAWTTEGELPDSSVPVESVGNSALTLETLPPEVIESIISHLRPIDLVRFMKVSKTIYQIGADHPIWKNIVICSLYEKSCRSLEEIAAIHEELNLIPGDRSWTWNDLFSLLHKLQMSQTEFEAHPANKKSISFCAMTRSALKSAKNLSLTGVSLGLSIAGWGLGLPGSVICYSTVFSTPIAMFFPPLLIANLATFVGAAGTTLFGSSLLVVSEWISSYQVETEHSERLKQYRRFLLMTREEFIEKYGDLPLIDFVRPDLKE